MSRKSVLIAFSISALLLSGLQAGGMALFEIYPTEWIFTPMHVFGGLIVGFFVLYLGAGLDIRVTRNLVLAAILVVGVAWEIMEYAVGFELTVIDTSTDLVADVAGALLAYWFVTRAR